MWGQLLLFLSSVYCLYLVIRYIPDQIRDLKIMISMMFVVWLAGQIAYTGEFNFYEAIHHDFVLITTISLILSAELILVRMMRPAIFRYPYFLIYTPILIPISFILIINTHLIKDIVFMATQGIGILVYLLFVVGKQELQLFSKKSIAGLIMVVLSYGTYWFIVDYFPISTVVYEILLAAGSVLLIQSLVYSLQQHDLDK